jgi:hypothetical protein
MAASAKLALLWNIIQDHYKAAGTTVRLNHLQLSMITDPDSPHQQFPYFKAKAAETRHLLPIMAQIARDYNTGSAHDQHRQAVLDHVLAFDVCLNSAGMFLTDQEASFALCSMQSALVHYQWLHCWAEAHDRRLWHIVPKFHMCLHMAQSAYFMNPQSVWTFRSEDYVGRIATLAHSVTFGCRRTRQSAPLLHKYLVCLHLRLTRGDFAD